MLAAGKTGRQRNALFNVFHCSKSILWFFATVGLNKLSSLFKLTSLQWALTLATSDRNGDEDFNVTVSQSEIHFHIFHQDTSGTFISLFRHWLDAYILELCCQLAANSRR